MPIVDHEARIISCKVVRDFPFALQTVWRRLGADSANEGLVPARVSQTSREYVGVAT